MWPRSAAATWSSSAPARASPSRALPIRCRTLPTYPPNPNLDQNPSPSPNPHPSPSSNPHPSPSPNPYPSPSPNPDPSPSPNLDLDPNPNPNPHQVQYLASHLRAHGAESLWIGLRRLSSGEGLVGTASNSNFRWESGATLSSDEARWAATEPNGAKGDCVEMWEDGTWNDRACDIGKVLACELVVH